MTDSTDPSLTKLAVINNKITLAQVQKNDGELVTKQYIKRASEFRAAGAAA